MPLQPTLRQSVQDTQTSNKYQQSIFSKYSFVSQLEYQEQPHATENY